MKIPDEDRERYLAMQKKLMDEMFDSLSGPEMRNNVARIYSETFTKDELSSMSAFYATPAGQAVVAKQPEVQQKDDDGDDATDAAAGPAHAANDPRISGGNKSPTSGGDTATGGSGRRCAGPGPAVVGCDG